MRKNDLIELIVKGDQPEFLFFWKMKTFPKFEPTRTPLSQWHMSDIKYEGKIFTSAEQLMMYRKAVLFGDLEAAKEIRSTNSPFYARKLGQQVSNFTQSVWDDKKEKIVYDTNILKFSQNLALKTYLLSTEDKILVECCLYDLIWGIGSEESDPRSSVPMAWHGENLLGFILMEVREELKRQQADRIISKLFPEPEDK